ncbi:hypothetical protein [Patulibacter defluvii]|uniref:hypothetical protein n=1 Tax=Patulibacter defluvii TaxID=3095358 RepID=UPI002A74C29D|nr:hypothetical protein [Patulibacter sp. DM4]
MGLLAALIAGLVGAAPAAAADGPAGGERCGAPLSARGEPAVAFVVLDGNHSEEPETGAVHPLPVTRPERGVPVVGNYCPVGPDGRARRFPPGMQAGLRRLTIDDSRVCRVDGGLRSDACMLARLADAGAVVLPFSYAGATLDAGPRGAVFRFTGYRNRDSIQDPAVSVARLEAMVASIERTWPATAIVVGAHSLGGTIAEGMWEQRAAAGRLGNLFRVYTWDSPINGIQNCVLGGALLGDLLGETIGSSRAVASEWCRRWADRDARNARIIELSRDGSFVAAGVPNDATYANTPLSGGGELRTQLVYRCPDDGSRADSPCIASPPSLVGRAPLCDAAGPGVFGVSGHDLVRVCPMIVRHQLATVRAATDDRVAVVTGCGGPPRPRTRPDELALDCRPDGAIVRELRWTSWGFRGAVATGRLDCRRAARSRCAFRHPRRVRLALSTPTPCRATRRFQFAVAEVPRVRTARRHRTTLRTALGCAR